MDGEAHTKTMCFIKKSPICRVLCKGHKFSRYIIVSCPATHEYNFYFLLLEDGDRRLKWLEGKKLTSFLFLITARKFIAIDLKTTFEDG